MNKPSSKHVICLYEASGHSASDWAKSGHDVFCYDILHEKKSIIDHGKGRIIKMHWDATDKAQNQAIIKRHKGKAVMALSFPPCTHLAVSGAAWFKSKLEADPLYRVKAMQLVYTGRDISEELGCPYVIENPVSVISSEWRKPDFIFHPWEFGGYLPEDDVHPEWPDYIMARDAYPKKTCYWTGNGFKFPEKKPVPVADGYSIQHKKLGGKSAKTKSIRSASPRGMARATFIANQ